MFNSSTFLFFFVFFLSLSSTSLFVSGSEVVSMEMETFYISWLNVPVGKEGAIYVSTMEGHFFALDSKTGEVLWSVDTGGPLVSTSFEGLSDFSSIPIPSLDGTVLEYSPQAGLQDFQFETRDIINNDFVCFRGDTLLLGSKVTKIFGVDLTSGTVLPFATSLPFPPPHFQKQDNQQFIYLARVEERIQIVDSSSGEEMGNFSIATIRPSVRHSSSPFSSVPSIPFDRERCEGKDRFPQEADEVLETCRASPKQTIPMLIANVFGGLSAVNPHSGRVQWTITLPSAATHLYAYSEKVAPSADGAADARRLQEVFALVQPANLANEAAPSVDSFFVARSGSTFLAHPHVRALHPATPHSGAIFAALDNQATVGNMFLPPSLDNTQGLLPNVSEEWNGAGRVWGDDDEKKKNRADDSTGVVVAPGAVAGYPHTMVGKSADYALPVGFIAAFEEKSPIHIDAPFATENNSGERAAEEEKEGEGVWPWLFPGDGAGGEDEWALFLEWQNMGGFDAHIRAEVYTFLSLLNLGLSVFLSYLLMSLIISSSALRNVVPPTLRPFLLPVTLSPETLFSLTRLFAKRSSSTNDKNSSHNYNAPAIRGGGAHNNQTPRKKKTKKKATGPQPPDPAQPLRPLQNVAVSTTPEGLLCLGPLTVSQDIIGHGSHGTVVLSGDFDGRPVAVKRLLRQFYAVARKEVGLLQASDTHPHVLRYYAMLEHQEFVYLALERCMETLQHFVDEHLSPGPLPLKQPAEELLLHPWTTQQHRLAREVLLGVASLHALGIVHRDLKPSNILLTHTHSVRVADMGLGRRIDGGGSSFYTTQLYCGSRGWMAPEQILSEGGSESSSSSGGGSGGMHGGGDSEGDPHPRHRVTKAVDVFSTGLVLHYILSGGAHPFGGRIEQEVNIVHGRLSLAPSLCGSALVTDLLKTMLSADPTHRPPISRCLTHPVFWSASRFLTFLLDLSDRMEIEEADSPLVLQMDSYAVDVFDMGPDPTTTTATATATTSSSSGEVFGWALGIGADLLENLGKYRKYKFGSLRDLLRVIRNKKNHFRDLPDHLRLLIGAPPADYLNFFHTRFPKLLLCCYQFVAASTLVDEPLFKSYFQPTPLH
eukprot:GCRY01000561.1.p1 GENE.GCRY01000561.1~~GCRY01000561.1.p1  ORF type:complete len:1105 (+),score=333.29 GCRY01000561.1:250-3564(+)